MNESSILQHEKTKANVTLEDSDENYSDDLEASPLIANARNKKRTLSDPKEPPTKKVKINRVPAEKKGRAENSEDADEPKTKKLPTKKALTKEEEEARKNINPHHFDYMVIDPASGDIGSYIKKSKIPLRFHYEKSKTNQKEKYTMVPEGDVWIHYNKTFNRSKIESLPDNQKFDKGVFDLNVKQMEKQICLNPNKFQLVDLDPSTLKRLLEDLEKLKVQEKWPFLNFYHGKETKELLRIDNGKTRRTGEYKK